MKHVKSFITESLKCAVTIVSSYAECERTPRAFFVTSVCNIQSLCERILYECDARKRHNFGVTEHLCGGCDGDVVTHDDIHDLAVRILAGVYGDDLIEGVKQ